MNKEIRQLSGANMDIDLTSNQSDINWKQTKCPWNAEENTNDHKCAIKNTSICKFFCGIKYLDSVLCSYPYESNSALEEDNIEQKQIRIYKKEVNL